MAISLSDDCEIWADLTDITHIKGDHDQVVVDVGLADSGKLTLSMVVKLKLLASRLAAFQFRVSVCLFVCVHFFKAPTGYPKKRLTDLSTYVLYFMIYLMSYDLCLTVCLMTYVLCLI